MLPIRLRGARTHNLRGVDVDLFPGELISVTGPSGAGKSSLALDTLYAEGQRRFVESFSPYARQFLERLDRPPIDSLTPVAATVAVDRKAPVKSSRSTLATMADLEAYLSAFFGREAVAWCPDCHVEAIESSPREAAAKLTSSFDGTVALVTYAAEPLDAERFLELREKLTREGYRRLFVAGRVREIDEVRPSEATAPGVRVEVVVDRVRVRKTDSLRLQEALETAWTRGQGRAEIRTESSGTSTTSASRGVGTSSEFLPSHSVIRGLACPICRRGFEAPRPNLFSYNSPLGACDSCHGFGRAIAVDWNRVIPDPGKSLRDGAIKPWASASTSWERNALTRFCARRSIQMDVPWSSLGAAERDLVLQGEGSWKRGKFPGVRAWFSWLESRTYKMHVRVLLSRYRQYVICHACGGSRLNAHALAYRVAEKNLAEWHALTVAEAALRVAAYAARDPQGHYVKQELTSRLGYLEAVGLGYLTLDRQARTLSGGEAQRASLTTALGASLTGTLFVLDEPTVGLHPCDVPALARVMRDLSRAGNTVMVVEHDATIVQSCDRVLEMGPGAGSDGGTVLFDGTPAELSRRLDLPTGAAWASSTSGARARRVPNRWMVVRGASEHNLQAIDAEFPLGVLCAVTGPSGSGKSTLARDILFRAVARSRGDMTVEPPGLHDRIEGEDDVAQANLVDQSPLGRTARGNAATYVKAWDRIRSRFASEPEAKRRNLTSSHFSFNVARGRCDACDGEGFETVEMQFLADVQLLCPVCQGRRFKPEVLAVRHRGLSIADVLAMSIDDVLRSFDTDDDQDIVLRRLFSPVSRLGMGYLALGQPLSTLSGGEAQRLKLARALGERASGALFVLDEPSAGLHARDASKVIEALHSLVDEGASVVVVEHDVDIIQSADWVIDLGPGGGPYGGRIVAVGTPEQIAAGASRTGDALRERGSIAKSTTTRERPTSGKNLQLLSLRPSSDVSPAEAISVSGAREHNLKNACCTIPHGMITVVTGPSGSGKSSLAFDVIFAEGQRRFMETLSPYARQFLPMLPRPNVESVTGVPPAIALEQRRSRGSTNSTVATVTEVAHYLRLLYAKLGEVHCPVCGVAVAPMSPDALFQTLLTSTKRGHETVYAPAVRARKGTHLEVFTMASAAGVKTARVDGAFVATDPPPKLAKSREHSIDLIVHFGKLSKLRRADFDRALAWGNGVLRIAEGPPSTDAKERVVSTARACPTCGTGIPELDPRWFSFNTKQGQCEACEGTGVEGGHAALEDGTPAETCASCGGSRLSAIARGVRLCGETFPETCRRSVSKARTIVDGWRFSGSEATLASAPLAELKRRLAFIDEVGLGYLALDRPAATLSGGEMQRLRLSAQLGSGLTGALYVLDEPTIGLHPRDTHLLISNLRRLANMGSTVLVVEHDAETIRAADHLIDLGPGGGRDGGRVVVEGSAESVLADPRSPTGRALAEGHSVEQRPLSPPKAWIELDGARENNLKNVNFRVPTARMCVVAGVSGSGKSTLVRQVFYPAIRRALSLVGPEPGGHSRIRGTQSLRRALAVDQSPIGRTPRSVPATFLGIWDEIRKLFASLPEAQTRGYSAARFSFNSATAGGRCPACDGQGLIVAEMPFMPDVISPCEACGGSRFEPSTLDVRFAGLSIGDVLHLPAQDAAQIFSRHPRIARPLALLSDLGVGYVRIGQGSNTLSGGEAQRLKLAAELTAGAAHEPTVYVLDEPTTGLHISDVRKLIEVMRRLVDRGDTLVVVEHHPDMIASADWVVELGPEGGDAGGHIIFEGQPSKLARAKTPTGQYLASRTR